MPIHSFAIRLKPDYLALGTSCLRGNPSLLSNPFYNNILPIAVLVSRMPLFHSDSGISLAATEVSGAAIDHSSLIDQSRHPQSLSREIMDTSQSHSPSDLSLPFEISESSSSLLDLLSPAARMPTVPGHGTKGDPRPRIPSLATRKRGTFKAGTMNNKVISRARKHSRDRFIPVRRSPTDAMKSFHMSKPLGKLSATEKLLRQRSASPDPFGPPSQNRTSQVERIAPVRLSPRRIQGLRSLAPGGSGMLGLRQPDDNTSRQPSVGAVWNVGGGSAAIEGPTAGVSNGRGGLLSSGSNAPMYVSRFLDGISPDQELEKHEGRLALALDVDQAGRILDFSSPSDVDTDSSPNNGYASSHTGDFRTVWQNNHWVSNGSPTRM